MAISGRIIKAAAGALTALALCAASAGAGTRQADAQLESAMQALVATPNGPPGVAVVVQRERKLRFHTAGRADLGSPQPIGLRQHLRIASVTKAYTAAVALRLVQKGRLRLDDTVAKWLPDLPAPWGAATLRELLQHTSGLPNYTADPDFGAYFSMHLKDYMSPLQAISFAFDQPLEFPPGTNYAYSNTDNMVIGLMAQRATGRSYENLLASLVLRPLKLHQTSIPSGFTLPVPFVSGYAFDAPGEPLENVSQAVSVSGVWASGAIVSTPFDENRFIRAWGGGDFLNKKLRRAQTRFILGAGGEPPGPGFNSGGLALYRYAMPCGTVFGHTGNFPGYTAFMASNRRGTRSATVNVNVQLDIPERLSSATGVFPALQQVFEAASCAALAR